jgi:hypothetical protein
MPFSPFPQLPSLGLFDATRNDPAGAHAERISIEQRTQLAKASKNTTADNPQNAYEEQS